MGQDVLEENEAATSDGADSEALWDTAETSLHITESGVAEEMSRGECVLSVRLISYIFVLLSSLDDFAAFYASPAGCMAILVQTGASQ